MKHFKPYQFTLGVSLLREVGQRNAAGGFYQVGLASKQQVRQAVGGRYRWRLRDSVSLDLSPGVVRMYMQGERFDRPADFEPRIGGTLEVDLHLSHKDSTRRRSGAAADVLTMREDLTGDPGKPLLVIHDTRDVHIRDF